MILVFGAFDLQNVPSPAGDLEALNFARPRAHTIPFRAVVDILQSLEQLCERQVGKGGADRVQGRDSRVLQDFDRLSLVGTLPRRQGRSGDPTRRFGRYEAEIARLGNVQEIGDDLKKGNPELSPPFLCKQSSNHLV